MGRIRRNVNWTAKITEGDTSENGFSIVGRKNPILVHVGETDTERDATVEFKQCEFDSRGAYKSDECVINQRQPLTFSLKYYDFDANTSYFSSGATVEFTSTNGDNLGTGFVESDGSCSFKYKDDSLTEIYAKIVVRQKKFNVTHSVDVASSSTYQTPIDVIREADNNIDYSSGIPASAETSYDYDNGTNTLISAGTTSEIRMLHKTESGGNIRVKKYGYGNIEFTNNEIHFSRNAVDETNAKFEDAEVVFYCGEEEEGVTVKFLAPKKAKINYYTTYKCMDYSSFDVSGVTSTEYDAFTKKLYDPDVFAYVAYNLPSATTGDVGLDIIVTDSNVTKTIHKSIHISLPDDTNIFNEPLWTHISSATTQVMSNNDAIFDNMEASLHVGAEERLNHIEKMPYKSSKAGCTQFRFANADNAAWAMDPKNGLVYRESNHPGFLRRTENPAMNLNVARITYKSGDTMPTVIESGITYEDKWKCSYMNSGDDNVNEPTVGMGNNNFSTWIVFDKTAGNYALSHIKRISMGRYSFASLKDNEVNASKIRDALEAALSGVSATTSSATTVDYPQFGQMTKRDQKYISFFSPSNRHVAIINRDKNAHSGETLEQDVYSNKVLDGLIKKLPHTVTHISALTSVELFSIDNGEVKYTANWGLTQDQAEYDINNHGEESITSSGYQWSVVMNMARTMVSASTVIEKEDGKKRDDIFDSGATSIYGFLYCYDVSDADSACTKSKLSKNSSGTYVATTDFYNPIESLREWQVPEGDTVKLDDVMEVGPNWPNDPMGITPIMITKDNSGATPNSYSGLTTIVNRETNLRASYEPETKLGNLITATIDFHNYLDDVQTLAGFKLSLLENNGDARSVSARTYQKDKFYYKKNYLTRIKQIKDGLATKLWVDDGEMIRNNSYFEYIQLGSGGTEGLYSLMNKKISEDTNYKDCYQQIKDKGGSIVAVFANTDNQIKEDTNVTNNPYNTGPWIFDFVNYEYSPYDESLCIELISGDSVTVEAKGFPSGGTLRYARKGGGTYSKLPDGGVTLSGSTKQIFLRGNFKNKNLGTIKISGNSDSNKVKVSNNIMSLVFSDDVNGRYSFKDNGTVDYMFEGLFSGNTCITDASGLYLLGDTRKGCFKYMFAGCTNLKVAPRLLAWDLKTDCYYGMFSGCTNLTDIYCMAKTKSASSSGATTGWLYEVPEGLTFVRNNQSDNNFINNELGVPSNTEIITLEDGRT